MLEIKTLVGSKENIKLCERVRYNSQGMYIEDKDLLNTNYASKMFDSEILTFGTFLDNNLAAGCYITDYFDSIHVYYLFVQKKYQETGMYLGRNLLSYILDNKEVAERYFHFRTNRSTLCYLNEKNKRIYEKLGYIEYDSKSHMMEKMLIKK